MLDGFSQSGKVILSVLMARQVVTFMNENTVHFRPDEHPELLAAKFEHSKPAGLCSYNKKPPPRRRFFI
jgi:hypothetical protein